MIKKPLFISYDETFIVFFKQISKAEANLLSFNFLARRTRRGFPIIKRNKIWKQGSYSSHLYILHKQASALITIKEKKSNYCTIQCFSAKTMGIRSFTKNTYILYLSFSYLFFYHPSLSLAITTNLPNVLNSFLNS